MGVNQKSKIVGGGSTGTFELPAPTQRRVMHQSWRDLLFLHWAFDPRVIQSSLPEGLTVDTFEGQAYVGVVPFSMEKIRPVGLPAVPGLSWFGELNLRTYVVGPDGSPGVWFYALDAHQRIAVWLAKTVFALPYHYAAIRGQRRIIDPSDKRGRVQYHWSRRGKSGLQPTPSFEYDAPSEHDTHPTRPGTLEHFLVERYLLFSRRPLFIAGPGRSSVPAGGGIYVGRVDHDPYRVAEAEMHRSDTSLFGLNGLETPAGPCVSALWSPGVDVSVYPLRLARKKKRAGQTFF